MNAPMLNQAATAALRIALFRAGPQDFPYAPALARLTVPLAVLAGFVQSRLTMPEGTAAIHSLAWVGALAALTYGLLQSRGLANRFRQTLDSLLLVDAAITFVMLPVLVALAPQMARIAANPDLARTETLPALPAFLLLLALLWNLLVVAHIFRHALSAPFIIGFFAALLAFIVSGSVAGALATLVS